MKQMPQDEIESNDEISYEPGDALGVFPRNKEEEIKAISPNKNVRLHRWILFFYVVLSIIFMTIALISLRHH